MSQPTPVYWSDGTYALVRWRDVPDDVTGWYCAERWEEDMHNPAQGVTAVVHQPLINDSIAMYRSAVKNFSIPLYDGATKEQCLARYHYLMLRADMEVAPDGLAKPSDEDLRKMGFSPGVKVKLSGLLTGVQKRVAQEQWSSALRTKVEATKTKEHNQVLVDLDFQP